MRRVKAYFKIVKNTLSVCIVHFGVNIIMNSYFKKFSYSFLANVFSAITSILMIIVLPKVMSLKDYGVWQLFLFYSSYVGFMHCGWIDGIYLRYGGRYYDELDRKIFSGQFILLVVLLCFEAILFFVFSTLDVCKDITLLSILRITALYGIFYNIITFVRYILQMSDRIEDYAKNVVLERLITIFLLSLCIFFHVVGYIEIISAKLLSVFILMIFSIFIVRGLIFNKSYHLRKCLYETKENISVGVKLMLSNIAGMLILGVIRFGISQGWDIVTFGKVSLTLMASNFLMIFVSAVSVVLFPFLKRASEEKITEIYRTLRRGLSLSLLGLLITYYPFSYLLQLWLPQYSDSMVFMGYLLPICIFESKMQMLIVTYLKSLRKEIFLLKINLASVVFSLITTYISVVIIHNLHLTILFVVINFAFRLFVGEYYIEKFLSTDFTKDRILESLLVAIFVIVNVMSFKYAILIYLTSYIIYLYNKKDELNRLLHSIKINKEVNSIYKL